MIILYTALANALLNARVSIDINAMNDMNRIPPVVFGAISLIDNMLVRDDPQSYEKYFGVGLNALMVISNAIEKYTISPKTILDLPSGFGRVARFFRAANPSATIYSSDVNKQATLFLL